ncbi:actinodefensin-associated protein B [Nocardia pseudobrasiliensis]|uniref:Uncharacterized protein n=1 Tax=Nocardia pseudobrasiliensis TaxID=45979 RepID=A0A370I269_9NOCA|nr:actinodefensin-associated protein B [Nocardia pseudobrasiliensis]RDI64796.1 hypothetical protein DFR76_107172 [Nocardia pseudobrasiliensis]
MSETQLWLMAEHSHLATLPFGGHVLVDLSDLTCHELSDEAVTLLTSGRLPVTAGEEDLEFVAHCWAAGWIRPATDTHGGADFPSGSTPSSSVEGQQL